MSYTIHMKKKIDFFSSMHSKYDKTTHELELKCNAFVVKSE